MRLFISILTLVSLVSCDKTYITVPTQPTTPSSPPVAVQQSRIEFRVIGNASSARIRYSHPLDGLTQTVTTLPFFVSISTDRTSMFLSLEVKPIGYEMGLLNPFVGAQIIVDGILFREATSSDSLLNTISTSGTWRK